ncbi:hypothetical protein [Novosphingobium sp.]|uniref:hypothetical protein n=1 Tax=Novosphingobium sp. TaxID=1874826 RepID=UPI00286E0767|nr:hypothetical protein [Novosphingobium sp.]
MSGDKLDAAPPRDGARFRGLVGLLALVAGIAGLGLLYITEVPSGNREPLLLALGVVLGWGSTVVNFEFGSSPSGRKAADAGLRRANEQPPAPASPEGEAK